MTTNAIMMTIGDRDDFMWRWFKWLPSELQIEIMKKIPGWKRELNKGDFVKFKMNIPVYESHKWNECWRSVNAMVSEYIFNEEKKKYEYCIKLCDQHAGLVCKSIYWRPIGSELEVYNVKDEVEREELMKWHSKIAKRRGYYIGFRKSRGQYVPYGVPTI